jgi:hypothetical protein
VGVAGEERGPWAAEQQGATRAHGTSTAAQRCYTARRDPSGGRGSGGRGVGAACTHTQATRAHGQGRVASVQT